MNGSNQNVIVICCFFSLGRISGMAKCSPFWAGHGSSGYVFRASFAHLSLEIVKKMSRYYLLSGLSRIFRKPFANVYISRQVRFAQRFQIYACGPRLYKTFHGFLHDSHIYWYIIVWKYYQGFRGMEICKETIASNWKLFHAVILIRLIAWWDSFQDSWSGRTICIMHRHSSSSASPIIIHCHPSLSIIIHH